METNTTDNNHSDIALIHIVKVDSRTYLWFGLKKGNCTDLLQV